MTAILLVQRYETNDNWLPIVNDQETILINFQVFVYEFNETGRRWIRVESIMTINDAVHDIAFAPNIGRSYLVLAVATNKDLRIISMKNSEDSSKKSGVAIATNVDNELSSKYQVRLAGHYNDHVSTDRKVVLHF